MTTAKNSERSSCHVCGRLNSQSDGACRRCGNRLHVRKPHSIQRTWALLITAALLYIPAMILPISSMVSLGRVQAPTLIGSVFHFWHDGAWPVALVVFLASVLIPISKLLGLSYLLISVQLQSTHFCRQRTFLYRVIEFVGRWSMIDVFVIALLVSLLQFEGLASMRPAPGIIAFALVVILTMFASMNFDPRLIWDALDGSAPGQQTTPA